MWKTGTANEKSLFAKREYFIKSVLTDIVPNLHDIWFKGNNISHTEYVFRDSIGGSSYCVKWHELPSGIKNIISMIGDILIRFYYQQKNIIDPAEFRGIVIIDEIDLHLHPQGQKDLVVNLTKTFPNIQFIVSTHSPIPLLGANEHSIFYRVKRDYRTVSIERLHHIEKYIGDLLPNQILTSDLFGLDSISSVRKKIDNKESVYTGDTFQDVLEYDRLKQSNFLKDADNNSFIKQFLNK